MRFRLLAAYRGTAYHGWQVQRGVDTVAGRIEDALQRVAREPVRLFGASRTDAGVHAWGQVAAFDYVGQRSAGEFFRALNFHLPPDIAVRALEAVADEFQPRHAARGKIYRYRICTGYRPRPDDVGLVMHSRKQLDADAMDEAAQHLLGEHDFSSFRGAGCDADSPVRTVYALRVVRVRPDEVQVHAMGSAFLKYMVRNLVGTLLDVGAGRRSPEWVAEVLAARDRRAAGQTADAHGLSLSRIFYPEFPWEGSVDAIEP
jgi:tRNA pseudouridine38-40 synthase